MLTKKNKKKSKRDIVARGRMTRMHNMHAFRVFSSIVNKTWRKKIIIYYSKFSENNRVANLNLYYSHPAIDCFAQPMLIPGPYTLKTYTKCFCSLFLLRLLATDSTSFVFVLLNFANALHNLVAPRQDRQHLHLQYNAMQLTEMHTTKLYTIWFAINSPP